MLGIVGPNGSGKTSLLKLLGKIVPVQQGSVALFGSSMSDLRQEAVAQSVACRSPGYFPDVPIHCGRDRAHGQIPSSPPNGLGLGIWLG